MTVRPPRAQAVKSALASAAVPIWQRARGGRLCGHSNPPSSYSPQHAAVLGV